ncbi:Aste57867_17605 [Aphanomyces stellatus]|uniref:Aste57867_17605 protein n=1 Tax=Aphanomyces stellatus TaxID=120398 RepID=A0A485L828_9STRA|nr:hypothetical protein As57867_017545 [Aphanomyces stellatus]VFT94356.1 Aste57867_17605 [Aphanomyces stellatus]
MVGLTGDGNRTSYSSAVPLTSFVVFSVGTPRAVDMTIAPPSQPHETIHAVPQWTQVHLPAAIPRMMLPLISMTHVACGISHVIVLSASHHVFTWGDNNFGQLGHGHTMPLDAVLKVTHAPLNDDLQRVRRGAVSLVAGPQTSAILIDRSFLWLWGKSLDDDDTAAWTTSSLPMLCARALHVSKLDGGILDVGIGHSHVVTLSTRGRVWTWGTNEMGSLGFLSSSGADKTEPRLLAFETEIAQVGVGAFHTLLATTDGAVYAFGNNAFGQCGVASSARTISVPTKIEIPVCQMTHGRTVTISCQGCTSVVGFDQNHFFAWGVLGANQVVTKPMALRSSPEGNSIHACAGRVTITSPQDAMFAFKHVQVKCNSTPNASIQTTLKPNQTFRATLVLTQLFHDQFTDAAKFEFYPPHEGLDMKFLDSYGDEFMWSISTCLAKTYTIHIVANGTAISGSPIVLQLQPSTMPLKPHSATPTIPMSTKLHQSTFVSGVKLSKVDKWQPLVTRVVRVRVGKPFFMHVQSTESMEQAAVVIQTAAPTINVKCHHYSTTITLVWDVPGRDFVDLSHKNEPVRGAPVEVHAVSSLNDSLTTLAEMDLRRHWERAHGSRTSFAALLLQDYYIASCVCYSVALEGIMDVRVPYDVDVMKEASTRLANCYSHLKSWEDIENLLATLVAVRDAMEHEKTEQWRINTKDISDQAKWVSSKWVVVETTPCKLALSYPLPPLPFDLSQLVVEQPCQTLPEVLKGKTVVLKVAQATNDLQDLVYLSSQWSGNFKPTKGNDEASRLRNLILERSNTARKSLHQIFRHFNRRGQTCFTMDDFVVAVRHLKFKVSSEEQYRCFDHFNIDGTGDVSLGAFKLFCVDPTHRSFWRSFCPDLIRTLSSKTIASTSIALGIFDQATFELRNSGYPHVECAGGWCSWESFVHGLHILKPTTTADEMARLCYRFDRNGNGCIDLHGFLTAIHGFCTAVVLRHVKPCFLTKIQMKGTKTTSSPLRHGSGHNNTSACLRSHQRPDPLQYSSPLAVRKLFESRAQAHLMKEGEEAILMGQANYLLVWSPMYYANHGMVLL